ncbi:MAG: enoyl-CoA hydratase/isomerase family protein, partial [Gemmatimonadetes bacterium]|nr:enoyl-CoA hydratase/isomerase family protein [Gemmatimonadota bacterium]
MTVTLDHPRRMNVLDLAGWETLGEVFEGLAGDDSVRCVIVEGAGEAAFSAGSDISGFAAHRSTPGQVTRYAAALRRGIEGVWDCPHPTVAAVRGMCVGGGLIIAACCDVRVCGESSRFGAPVNRLGATMAYEEMAPLLAAAGAGAVLEILLTGDLVDARRAREMGIVNRIVPDGEVGEGG